MLWTVARQAPLSMGFSRQEYWNWLSCPPPEDLPDPGTEPVSLTSSALGGGFFTTSTTWERKSESEVAQLCPTLCDPMDCSLPGSFIHGIFQARVLEWVAIAFAEGHHYHLLKFHIYVLIYCIGVFLSDLLHSV